MQFSQRSQPLWTSTATRSPTRNSSTPGPRAATVPAYSWPITNCPAGWPWSVRCSTFTSVPQIDATSIFSSASPSPGSGLGQASTRMSSAPWRTTAFMVADCGMGTSLPPGRYHRAQRTSPMTAEPSIVGREHWTTKGDVRLFLWEKAAGSSPGPRGTILFVHGSSMASTPTFGLPVPGRPDSSAMDYFARLGYDTRCGDMEGYGRSDKRRAINSNIANGADDLEVATDYIKRTRGVEAFFTYGVSSGALRAALFAERHPERVRRLALDAFVWTGRGSPTLADRKKKLPEFSARNRRPIDRAFVHSIFERDHPGTADEATIDAFADAIVALDDSVPTGTYVDMCSKLPLVDPAKITVPTIIMRGQWDGIAGIDDLIEFFKRLPNPDKQFVVMAGTSHASFHQKNYLMVYHILHSFFSQPEPVYRG